MDDLVADLGLAFNETFQMLSISTVLAIIGGLPLGFLIFVTDRNLFWQNRVVYLVSSVLVNIIRSVPFVILLVLLLPLTQLLLGNTIGPIAASVPLSVAAIAFYARLVDGALREVDKGIIEAAEAFGASPMRIICTVLLPEASAGLPARFDHHPGEPDRLLGNGGDCRRRWRRGFGDPLRVLPLRNPGHGGNGDCADYSGTDRSGAG
ncbi:binding-protein-dependent transport system inner membrane protein [Lelliottia amnigena]|nr:binding-protein-dependent transport system inner membrane protein [Lelliottia amnigena]